MTASEETKVLLKNCICKDCNLENNYKDECHSYSCYEVRERALKALDLLEKQEQGLLIELPVPIGSTVYRIDMFTSILKCEKCRFYNHNESYEYSACNISYTDHCHVNCYQIEKITNVDEKFIIYHRDDFGKTISSSLEEAENLLEELRIQGLHTCSSTNWEELKE